MTAPGQVLDPFVTPAELAGELRIPLATLYVWRHRGGGPPSIRIGRHLRYRRSEIDHWLAGKGDVTREAS